MNSSSEKPNPKTSREPSDMSSHFTNKNNQKDTSFISPDYTKINYYFTT